MVERPCNGDHRALIVQLSNAMQPRLDHARDVLEPLTVERRMVIARWLRESLDRNRQAFAGSAWSDIRTLLEALYDDIIWETPRRDSPIVDGGMIAFPSRVS
jgi:hypothetical protein